MRPRLNPRRSFRPLLEALETRALLSVCTVDRLTDVGEGEKLAGDLRYCIEQAQDKDSIQFAVKGRINLTRALPNLTRSISIEGPGADLLTVRRAGGFTTYRVFTVAAGVTASISGLTISNGNAGGIANSGTLSVSNSTISGNIIIPDACCGGGGGIANSGTLTVSNSTISGNTSVRGGHGGGIFNSGTLTVNNSTISGNYVLDGHGGGIGSFPGSTLTVSNSTISGNIASDGGAGGGIYFVGVTLTVRNSTISGNTAVRDGGGGIFGGGTLRLSNSTISGNAAVGSIGGGIHIAGGSLLTRNTIIAGNMAPRGPDVNGNVGSQGYNLIGNTEGGSGFDKTDLLDVDPLLGPLQDNGGPTWTHALMEGSPAIDVGDPTDAPEWDQRGEGYGRIAGKNIDIGAYEEQGSNGPSPGSHGFDVAALLTLQLSQDRRGRS